MFYYWARSIKINSSVVVHLTLSDYLDNNEKVFKSFKEIEQNKLAKILDVKDFFFSGKNDCKITSKKGQLIYNDTNHLNPTGAIELMDFLEKQLLSILQES